MKKIILFISLVLFMRNVNAETIYGDYYKVEKLNNEPLDEIKIEEYKLYNTFKINYKDLGYLEENNNYLKDDNDFIEEIIDSSKEEISSDEYITISTLSLERNTIFLGEISNNFKVSEIEVYYKDKKIDYEINNEHLYKNIENIKDNNLNTFFENSRLNNNLVLKLNEFYSSKDLKVIIYTEENSLIFFKLYVDNKIPIELGNNKKHILNFINDKKSTEVTYRYLLNKKLYKYYEEEKIPQNIYVEEGENLLLEDYKVNTNYYKRDKLVLNDNLIINYKNQDIAKFIEYSSDEVKINHNIDYMKNGIYICEFTLNDIKVVKDIVVNIESNKIVEKVKTNENKEMANVNNKVTTNIKLNKDTKIKNRIKNTEAKKITKTTLTIPTKKVKHSSVLTKNYQNKKQEKRIYKTFISTIIIIFFIILEIIIIYKKKKR